MSDVAGEYEAATQKLAIFERSHRTRLGVSGRAPGQMLKGVLTGFMPPAPAAVDEGVWGGRATYHTVLTPKGKMISDLWATLLGDEAGPGYLLDVPAAGRKGLLESFSKMLPPRFAKVEDASERTAMITAVGPDAARALSSLALGLRVEATQLGTLVEGEWRAVGPPEGSLIVQRVNDVWPDAYSVFGPSAAVRALRQSLVEAGARPSGHAVWSILRVEAGRPAFGTDMGEDTIPTEAGIEDRAIDHGKGCYTGQEVIVRIRDRGHVNRKLERLQLGDGPTPPAGTELLAADGSDKVVGRITSAVQSPRHGGVLALAYVARGHQTVRLDGREVAVPG
ncbi:MAG TPA: glycine cleavage T C-terminal barrel domain-containing protein [Longimicrobiales bacterium]|nr:glycine cleavage T C-terminal barrel domain-containing protein [Longimicrobiales bacterium]